MVWLEASKTSIFPPVKISHYTVLIGEERNVTFNASASGIGTLRYQWKKRGSDRLPDKVLGNDTLTLTIPNIEKSDEGDYYCIVTNMWNRSVESNSASP